MNLQQVIEKLEDYEFWLVVSAPDVYTEELKECVEALKALAKEQK